jgi:hypothetical protein
VKERRKPGRGRQSPGTGGGLAFEVRSSLRKGGGRVERALVDGRRLGSHEVRALDGALGKGGPGGERCVGRGSARADRRQERSSSRQGASEVDAHSSPAEDNAAERGAPLRGLADIGAHQDSGVPAAARWRTRERRIDRSAGRIVKCETPRRVRRRQLRWSGSDCESGPSTPGVERSVAGARDVGRLQKSVRSTLSVHDAGVHRRDPRKRSLERRSWSAE